MKLNLTATIASAALFAGALTANAEELRLSHQWSTKDVRHQVAQMVADEVAAAGVDLEIKIFPSNRCSNHVSNTSRSAVGSWI
jgi:TRAP-type C4-dicarboxylate transport system substrate-binding protein